MRALVVKNVTDPFSCFPPHVPDWILPIHGLKLFHGVLGKMMMQAGLSYSNPKMAAFHLQKFQDGISGAFVSSSKANTVNAQPWAFPQQFRVFGQRGGVSTYNINPTPRE
jgi:hypothetical protein